MAERIGAALWRTAFVLVSGTFMATLDATIVSVGIKELIADFDAPVTEIQWVTTAYLLAVVTAVPASGWLAGRFGGKRTWIAAVVLFLLGSVLCALAWSAPSLIAFRVLQGFGGGLLPPVGQAVLARAAGPERIGRVMSVVAVVPLLSPVLGPLIGGSILGVADWPWLFYVNLPIGIAVLVLAPRCVPADPPAGQKQPFDLLGAVLLSPGIALLVFGLGEVGSRTVPVGIALGAALLGLGMLAGFVRHGLRSTRPPLLDPRLFARPPLGAAALALVVLGASVFGTMFLLPLYLQTGRGLSSWEAGLLLAPQGLGAVLGSLLVNRLIDRKSPRGLVLAGIALIALGTAPLTGLAVLETDALLGSALLVRGLGIAMIGAPVMSAVYRRMRPPELPGASCALNMLNTVGGSVGTALIAVVLQAKLADQPAPLAFTGTFWWVLGCCLVAVLGAILLPSTAEPEPRPAQRA
ncbi:multidrug efflux MFS transporter [Saccharopolyspora indica]|uniref:MDR family MFS transporter n=1 Tax=Saccharopolyspora indica TaxID=1229659 RepID=UPI0022EB6259|nr:MDR family MFS transporter [Saccharopolyspora indica]MDA3642720.1 MDR family MFS transporter [Saccharopolyspora indica]